MTRRRITGEPRVHTTRRAKETLKTPHKVEEQQREVPVEDGNAGALAAKRALGLQNDRPRATANKGASSAKLGAQLMSSLKDVGKKAVTGLLFGMILFGATREAAADVIHVGNRSSTQAVAQKLAQQANEPYVHINADKAALEGVLKRAEAGEIKLTHLILAYDEGKLPSSWEWQQLKQQYPKAFQQVERVHVIGHSLDQNPFQSWQGTMFENVKAIVSLDLSTAVEPGAASGFVLEQTTKAIADGMSTTDALLRAKTIANTGANAGVRTRVDIADKSHVQAPENAMSVWLDARTKDNNTNITKSELEAQLKQLAAGEGGLTDGMLGVLSWRMNQRGFKVDYDAARFASHVLDIRRAAGPERAVKALNDGDVHQVRHQLAVDGDTTQYAQPRSSILTKEITRGVPISGDVAIPTGGVQGTAYLVDGLGVIRNGEVQVQAIRHPKHGDGYQLTMKLADLSGEKLEQFMAANPDTRLIDKTIVNQSPQDGRVVTADKSDAVAASTTVDNQQPDMSIGPALRLEKPGEYRIDYFPESISKQSLRYEVHVQVYGANDAERNARLRSVLDDIGLGNAVSGKPSAETEQKLMALRLLEQADPRAHHAMMDRIEKGESVTLQQLHDALVIAEVPPAFLQQAYFAEASPGHLSVIVPGQSEAYARRGVRAVYHTVSKAEIFAFIAADGALMSTKDRLQVGKVFRGMSSDTDLRTGGADYVFTRQITAGMGNPNMYEMRGGAIVMKHDALDRADWFAYSGDQYGTTLTGDRGKPTDAVKQLAQRSYDELKAKNDPSVSSSTSFDQWFNSLLQSQIDHRENTYLTRPVGRHQVTQTTGSSNETMLEGTIPLSQIEKFVVRTEEDKNTVVTKLKELGVHEINGVKVEDFVQVRADKFYTDEEWKELDKQHQQQQLPDEIKDKRLQFYVRYQGPTPGTTQGGGSHIV